MQEIQDVIMTRAARFSAGDVAGMQESNAPSVVDYSLAPPLVAAADGRDPKPPSEWIAGFEAPPRFTVTDLNITADRDVAFATSLNSMTAVPRGSAQEFTLWYRVTLGLRRVDGRWLVTHQHHSVPFYMDGSMRAAVDLKP
jgi:ketosteroid isomerase-like protein